MTPFINEAGEVMAPTGLTLRERILEIVRVSPGLTDREITDRLSPGTPQQPVNQACRMLESKGHLRRAAREDGKIGNYPQAGTQGANPSTTLKETNGISEDSIKAHLKVWLEANGWQTQVAWGKSRGIDVEAIRQGQRWIIEVKGSGSLDPMRVNYFLAILGETLQRMSDPVAKYSIALPGHQQFRNLWARLPRLAKERTKITALFVDADGTVEEIDDLRAASAHSS